MWVPNTRVKLEPIKYAVNVQVNYKYSPLLPTLFLFLSTFLLPIFYFFYCFFLVLFLILLF